MPIRGKKIKSILKTKSNAPEKQMILRSAKKHVNIRENLNIKMFLWIEESQRKIFFDDTFQGIIDENLKNRREIRKGLKKEIEEIA